MSITELKAYIQKKTSPVSISEILAEHPELVRRTVQRWLEQLVKKADIQAIGSGRSRKYLGIATMLPKSKYITDPFPSYIPTSPDSKDIIHYVSQPFSARHPVGYDHDFLSSYTPNKTYYLSEPIRRQLHRVGKTLQATQPAGTYGRDIYNRLLIDLSWASSHLEGNTSVSYTHLRAHET